MSSVCLGTAARPRPPAEAPRLDLPFPLGAQANMLIHLVPRLYNQYADVQAELLDVSIPEISLALRNGKDIVARRPYPNKCYLVACRRKGHRAMSGLLVETHRPLQTYTCVTRWALNAELVITHQVEHQVIDTDLEAASDDLTTWYAMAGFGNRWPPNLYPDSAPVQVQPRMDIVRALSRSACSQRSGACFSDTLRPDGIILKRIEHFRLPTIEPGRLFLEERIPPLAHAFRPD